MVVAWSLCGAGLLACTSARAPHAPGEPFYFERFDHPFPSFFPTLPFGEISRREATSRSAFVVAWFNERGQIVRMLKCLNAEASFNLQYRYDAAGSYAGEEFAPLPPADSEEGRRLTSECS